MMDLTIRNFHNTIIKTAVDKLGRKLTEKEKQFITSQEGFVALEMILDTVKAETKEHKSKNISILSSSSRPISCLKCSYLPLRNR